MRVPLYYVSRRVEGGTGNMEGASPVINGFCCPLSCHEKDLQFKHLPDKSFGLTG